jgi:chemotaxis protein methyltransferase CheR
MALAPAPYQASPARSISEAEYAQFKRFIFDAAGISLGASKQALVMGRLAKRLAHHGLERFGEYFELLAAGTEPGEVQIAVDLLTTNETYFFREARHLELLRERAAATRQPGQPYRVWSAASSSGEEAYSIAMVLDDGLASAPWEVLGTDISSRVLHSAARAVYPMERARHLPPAYLRRYCLKGTDEHTGCLLIAPALRGRVRFSQVNLNVPLPHLGSFDAIFLRNVMIYFSDDTKRQVVARVLSALKPGGLFFVGLSESLNGLSETVLPIAPSVYRKHE